MGVFTRIKHHTGEGIAKYGMIKEGDRIMVCMSGGKDSYTLFDVLLELKKKAPINFELFPIIVDPGFEMEYNLVAQYLEKKNIPFHLEKSKIAEVINKIKPKNNCFMCSRLRRGVIYTLAQKFNCNKIALGHHLDDAIETFLLNTLYASKLAGLKPMYTSDDGKNIIIRPMIFVHEKDIEQYSEEEKFPIVHENCALKSTDSKRLMLKNLIKDLASKNKFLHTSMKNSMMKLYKKSVTIKE